MQLDYKKNALIIRQRLATSHDRSRAKIRGEFFSKEYNFFKKYIRDQIVLVAGSGLGHDSFELAKYNQAITGYELLYDLFKAAQAARRERKIKNVEFIHGNFLSLPYPKKIFQAAVLNMGTLGDFADKEAVLRELLRVADTVYADFYPPTRTGLEKRRRMYVEEKWQNVRVEGQAVVSDDGLYSVSITQQEMEEIAANLMAEIKFYILCDFAVMAEIKNKAVK